MTDMTLERATSAQLLEIKQITEEIRYAERAACKAWGKWGRFWREMGLDEFCIPIPDDEMERVLQHSTALQIALMRAKTAGGIMGVMTEKYVY